MKVIIDFVVSISNNTQLSFVYDAAICPVSVLMKLTEVGVPFSIKYERDIG